MLCTDGTYRREAPVKKRVRVGCGGWNSGTDPFLNGWDITLIELWDAKVICLDKV